MMQRNTDEPSPFKKGQLVIYNDVNRKAFFLAEVLDVLPDFDYRVRIQVDSTAGFTTAEEIVMHRYLVTLARFMELMQVARRPGL